MLPLSVDAKGDLRVDPEGLALEQAARRRAVPRAHFHDHLETSAIDQPTVELEVDAKGGGGRSVDVREELEDESAGWIVELGSWIDVQFSTHVVRARPREVLAKRRKSVGGNSRHLGALAVVLRRRGVPSSEGVHGCADGSLE